jgi:hypothetical protein
MGWTCSAHLWNTAPHIRKFLALSKQNRGQGGTVSSYNWSVKIHFLNAIFINLHTSLYLMSVYFVHKHIVANIMYNCTESEHVSVHVVQYSRYRNIFQASDEELSEICITSHVQIFLKIKPSFKNLVKFSLGFVQNSYNWPSHNWGSHSCEYVDCGLLGNHLQDHTASQSRRPAWTSSPHWESQISHKICVLCFQQQNAS